FGTSSTHRQTSDHIWGGPSSQHQGWAQSQAPPRVEAPDMPKDAKLGLIIGVGLVIAVAVVFFRGEALSTQPRAESPAATAVKPAPATPPAVPRGQIRPTRARTANRGEDDAQSSERPRRHTVVEGDTLSALAERYYGNKDKAGEIYQANRTILQGPDE